MAVQTTFPSYINPFVLFHLILVPFLLLLQAGAEQRVEGRRVFSLSPACLFLELYRDFGSQVLAGGRHAQGLFASLCTPVSVFRHMRPRPPLFPDEYE
ncbi:hypothetical protein K438DRAFT_1810426 [Mycena galopus ATCC 62051]|nr:hypothetical protein K438DRAFT_1810426 [Mycena galopus ATCC 62051]